jgi:hypothetical protein
MQRAASFGSWIPIATRRIATELMRRTFSILNRSEVSMIRIAIAGSVLLLMSGCASITTGQNQTVSVVTPNCPGASCELVNKDGTFYVPVTPGTVMVNRACGALSVRCSMEGHEDALISVGSSVKAMAFGNIIFGGFIGAGVDAVTGAACQYPSMIPVPMDCGFSASSQALLPEAMGPALAATVKELACTDVHAVGEGPDGSQIFSAQCEEGGVLLICSDDKDCQVSEYDLLS